MVMEATIDNIVGKTQVLLGKETSQTLLSLPSPPSPYDEIEEARAAAVVAEHLCKGGFTHRYLSTMCPDDCI